ncbi:hypothetical protein Hanom_Chr11g01038991 [Helianthus anomalus]
MLIFQKKKKIIITTIIIIKKKELITDFVLMVCQKSLFQSISLKIEISVPMISLS